MSSIDIKTQILGNTRISKSQSFQKTAQEGQQHYSDKLEKDHDEQKTSINELEKTEEQNIDKDGKRDKDNSQKNKKKKDQKRSKEEIVSKEPDKGNFIDIKT